MLQVPVCGERAAAWAKAREPLGGGPNPHPTLPTALPLPLQPWGLCQEDRRNNGHGGKRD